MNVASKTSIVALYILGSFENVQRKGDAISHLAARWKEGSVNQGYPALLICVRGHGWNVTLECITVTSKS
jgi:hypothetical protein